MPLPAGAGAQPCSAPLAALACSASPRRWRANARGAPGRVADEGLQRQRLRLRGGGDGRRITPRGNSGETLRATHNAKDRGDARQQRRPPSPLSLLAPRPPARLRRQTSPEGTKRRTSSPAWQVAAPPTRAAWRVGGHHAAGSSRLCGARWLSNLPRGQGRFTSTGARTWATAWWRRPRGSCASLSSAMRADGLRARAASPRAARAARAGDVAMVDLVHCRPARSQPPEPNCSLCAARCCRPSATNSAPSHTRATSS